jgi:sulfopropanediol 3-dehydrogenase
LQVTYLKKSGKLSGTDDNSVTDTVRKILAEIETGGEAATRAFALRLDGWDKEILVSADEIAEAGEKVPQRLKDDIRYAHDNIAKFARAQLASCQDIEIELRPGLWAGQKLIPIQSVGCYVPGGRYSHIASAMMTVITARVAGSETVSACSPPSNGGGISPAILYTLDYCGADQILTLGGVQGIAALAFGQFGAVAADILVGPGNQFVAEAKRLLFGRVGIDMVAGPTDSLILADEQADAGLVAWDLAGQAEHGYNSPVWLATNSQELAHDILQRVPGYIAELPQPNRASAEAAWRDLGEVVLCETREDMAKFADMKAPEHLHVQADDLDWWKDRLRAYGSLFLGAETTVAFGDKASGANHVLPTSGAARYTGGLSVHKFLKTVTWQKAEVRAVRELAQVTARISRFEGMEGHARTADIRLERYFPEEEFVLSAQ